MDKIKKAKDSTKKFINDHKVIITFTLTAALCLKLNKMALKDHDDFLVEKGLSDEYYTPQD